ncbi:hypothetical protein LRP30_13415 [Bradyrhizobium sp. C-145]|uniref:helix-turn-helix domain-containing protein n=1 Tax=Bradyrhizobium sp. C-145 TaxID=574727 RepID=UPI00201B8F37|nr:helix-turn-helix domain-containing protein [Bradyrhizobium sp. C-145]UQR66185.1 hypothetical protein LRP30_13415 [Bradyrhizobium sp. C-145]
MQRGAELAQRYSYDEARRYREMAREFQRIRAARPYVNQCVVARDLGARAFGISVDHLLAGTREADVTAIRQKLMAFTHVMTGLSFRQIATVFDRDHSAVGYACNKYERAIRAAVADRG